MLSRKTKVLLFLALLGVVFLAVAWLALRDERPSNDAHLRSYRRDVKEEENGFRLMDLKEQDIWNDDEEPELEWSSATFDRARAAELVERNEAVLQKVDRCLALPEFQVDVTDFSGPYPYLPAWRELTSTIAIRARLHLESERAVSAFEDAMRIVRLGRRVQSSQGTLIVYLYGTGMESLGLQVLLYATLRGNIPPEALRRSIPTFGEPLSSSLWLQDALKAEYVSLSKAFDDLGQGKVPDPALQMGLRSWLIRRPFLKPNQCKRHLCEEIGLLISSARIPPSERETLDYETKYASEITWSSFLRGGGGKVLLGLILVGCRPALTRLDMTRFQCEAMRILFALELAHAETGVLPGSLDELVPRWLSSVPLDPFDGKPLRYSASKQVIYSVGTDGRDAGGRDQGNPMDAFGETEEPTLRFSADAWSLEAMEKTKEDSTKRAKKRPKPRTRP